MCAALAATYYMMNYIVFDSAEIYEMKEHFASNQYCVLIKFSRTLVRIFRDESLKNSVSAKNAKFVELLVGSVTSQH